MPNDTSADRYRVENCRRPCLVGIFTLGTVLWCGDVESLYFYSGLRRGVASRQRLEAGDHVEQLFIDGFLSNPAEGAV